VPATTEDRTFRLFGLVWTGASETERREAARALVATQREDGGWSQLAGRPSDAYATGEVLVALREAGGIATTDPVYVRGLRFLLRTQAADGSWHVVSRLNPPAPVSPPYFETGFPYGHDQFVSAMATAWATNALMQALPTEPQGAPAQPVAVAPRDLPAWAETALDGTVADLRRLLDGGLDPKAKTPTGMSVLMLAARDADKVRLLVERGADVNARATNGFTALMVAAGYRGSAASVRLLLEKGARIATPADVKVANDASPLFLAVMAGDVASVDALCAAGASVKTPMTVLGLFASDPFVFGSFGGDPRLVDRLVAAGADPNVTDGEGITALGWAALMNDAEMIRALVRHGADVNHVDKRGMTALLYAASVDYGDTAVVDALLASGADPTAKTKEGRTALELARSYGYAAAAQALGARTAKRGS
jgi:ankyrin repeat protein